MDPKKILVKPENLGVVTKILVNDSKVFMDVPFIIAFWACYVNCMHTKPSLDSDAAKKVTTFSFAHM